jgi:hypothetical protein
VRLDRIMEDCSGRADGPATQECIRRLAKAFTALEADHAKAAAQSKGGEAVPQLPTPPVSEPPSPGADASELNRTFSVVDPRGRDEAEREVTPDSIIPASDVPAAWSGGTTAGVATKGIPSAATGVEESKKRPASTTGEAGTMEGEQRAVRQRNERVSA